MHTAIGGGDEGVAVRQEVCQLDFRHRYDAGLVEHAQIKDHLVTPSNRRFRQIGDFFDQTQVARALDTKVSIQLVNAIERHALTASTLCQRTNRTRRCTHTVLARRQVSEAVQAIDGRQERVQRQWISSITQTPEQLYRYTQQTRLSAVLQQGAVIVSVDRVTNGCPRHVAEVSRGCVILVHRDRVAASAFELRVDTAIIGDDTVITRWQLIEQVRAVHVRDRDVVRHSQLHQVRRTRAGVKQDGDVVVPGLVDVLRAVNIGVVVHKVTNGTHSPEAEVSGQLFTALDFYFLTVLAFKRFTRVRACRGHTVVAVWHFSEQVQTVGIRSGGCHQIGWIQRRQIGRTVTRVQLNRRIGQRIVRRIIGTVPLVVGVDHVAHRTRRRKAKVDVQAVSGHQRHGLLARTFVSSTVSGVDHADTVLTRYEVVEAVQTVKVGLRGRNDGPRRGVTGIRLQRYRCTWDWHISGVRRAIEVVIGVDKVPDRHQRRIAEVSGQNRVTQDCHRLTRCAFDRLEAIRTIRNHTVVTVRHFSEQVQAIHVRVCRPQTRRQGGQIGWTQTGVKTDRDEWRDLITHTKDAIKVVIDVSQITH